MRCIPIAHVVQPPVEHNVFNTFRESARFKSFSLPHPNKFGASVSLAMR